MTVGIVGLGLIGGSMAKAIKRHTKHRVLGYDIAESEMCKAELVGAIDGRLHEDMLGECGVVVIALYPHAIIRYIEEHAARFGEGALVVDCGGVKQAVCERINELASGQRWTFIGGHPMSGREYSGFRYATDDLFDNASMILTPGAGARIEAISAAKEFFLDMGFRRVVFSTPERHDEMIAYTSQMAHIISSAYVRSDLAFKHKGFSAGSFQDMTRVARLNEAMWTELFLLNRVPLMCELDGMIERLQAYRDALGDADEGKLKAMLSEGCERKQMLDV